MPPNRHQEGLRIGDSGFLMGSRLEPSRRAADTSRVHVPAESGLRWHGMLGPLRRAKFRNTRHCQLVAIPIFAREWQATPAANGWLGKQGLVYVQAPATKAMG